MGKYIAEVGGYQIVFRHRKITVYASDPMEAEEKAKDKFIELMQSNGDCNEAYIDSIEEE